MTQINFDADQVEPNSDFQAMPPGDYLSTILSAAMVATKDKLGAFLEIVFQIIDGPHTKRQITTRLNLKNRNPKAVELAEGELSSICRAIFPPNHRKLTDTDQLVGGNLILRLKIITRRDTGEPDNAIRKYLARPSGLSSVQSGMPSPPPVSTPQAAPLPVAPQSPVPADDYPTAPYGSK